jgi:hypothetical protein
MLSKLLIAMRLKPRPFNMKDYEAALRKVKLNYLKRSTVR